MIKYFYEKSDILSWPSNITYGELVTFDDNRFYEWAEDLRMRVLTDWDNNGKPPVVGRTEEEINHSLNSVSLTLHLFFIVWKKAMTLI